jgi:hypothetical protein
VILQKLGGGCRCGCDAQPHGWCGLHIPGAQNRGEFLQQRFYVSRDRIRNFLQRTGGLAGAG